MSEDSQRPNIDPELEARLVALVLGEASDFEREELERLCAEQAELAAFREQVRETHGLLSEIGAGEFASSEEWKLSPERRKHVLATFSGQRPPSPRKARLRLKDSTRRRLISRLSWLAAVFCVVGCLGSVVFFSLQSQFQVAHARADVSMRKSERRNAWLDDAMVPPPDSSITNEAILSDFEAMEKFRTATGGVAFEGQDAAATQQLGSIEYKRASGADRFESGASVDADSKVRLAEPIKGQDDSLYDVAGATTWHSTTPAGPRSTKSFGVELGDMPLQQGLEASTVTLSDSSAPDDSISLAVPEVPSDESRSDFYAMPVPQSSNGNGRGLAGRFAKDKSGKATSGVEDWKQVRESWEENESDRPVTSYGYAIQLPETTEEAQAGDELMLGVTPQIVASEVEEAPLADRRYIRGNFGQRFDGGAPAGDLMESAMGGMAGGMGGGGMGGRATDGAAAEHGYGGYGGHGGDNGAWRRWGGSQIDMNGDGVASQVVDYDNDVASNGSGPESGLARPQFAAEGESAGFSVNGPAQGAGEDPELAMRYGPDHPRKKALNRQRESAAKMRKLSQSRASGDSGEGDSAELGFGERFKQIERIEGRQPTKPQGAAELKNADVAAGARFGATTEKGLTKGFVPQPSFANGVVADDFGRVAGNTREFDSASDWSELSTRQSSGPLPPSATTRSPMYRGLGIQPQDPQAAAGIPESAESGGGLIAETFAGEQSRLANRGRETASSREQHYLERAKQALGKAVQWNKAHLSVGQQPNDGLQGGVDLFYESKSETVPGLATFQLGRDSKASAEGMRFRRGMKSQRQAPIGLDEQTAQEESFSTFSLHVSDVSFKLARAALGKGEWPDAAKIRIEEFVNAFDYGDPLPAQRERVACQMEQAIHPFLQQRNVLRVAMRTAATGRAANTPLRLTFLLDNSGSMERPDRQQTVRRAFALLAQQLKPIDQVTLISFARQPRLLADKVAGDKVSELVKLVDTLPSEGGTNIEAALQLAFEKSQEQQVAGSQNRIVLLTDGAVNLGNADPESLSEMVSTMRDAGVAFDAAGIIADGLNDEVLEALTRKGDGRYYLLDNVQAADDGFVRQIAGALRPSAKNVKVQVEFNPRRVGRYKLLGFEKHRLKKEDFRNDKVDAAEMAAAEAGVAVYQFEAKPDGDGDVGSIFVRFRDLSSGEMVERRWPIPYEASAPRLDQASASLRVATSAAMFAAKLRGEPLGAAVDLPTLSELVTGLPRPICNASRVLELQQMLQQARSIGGK